MTPPSPRQARLLAGLWPVLLAVLLGSGWIVADLLVNRQIDYTLHDTYYVVAHWSWIAKIALPVLGFVAVYAVLAAGRVPYRFGLDVMQLAAAAAATALGLLFTPQLILGLNPPTRIIDYDPDSFRWVARFTQVAWAMFTLSLVLFLVLVGEVVVRLARKSKS